MLFSPSVCNRKEPPFQRLRIDFVQLLALPEFREQGVSDGSAREDQAVRFVTCRAFLFSVENLIGEAKLHSLLRIHPRFGVHEPRNLRSGQPRLDFVGIDDALLNLGKQCDDAFHLLHIADGNGHRIVD